MGSLAPPQSIDTLGSLRRDWLQWIAIAAGNKPGETLVHTTRTLLGGLPGSNTRSTLLAQKVLAAVIAIERWEEKHPGRLLGLTADQPLFSRHDLSMCVRAPHILGLADFLSAEKLAQRLRADANHISLVLELRMGGLSLLLTGDLPYLRSPGASPVPTGWTAVSARVPHLGVHQGLKVPHHGSAEAMHPGWLTPRSAHPRAWFVTPYNSSALPKLNRLEGLPRLLSAEPEILLTAISASKQVQAVQPQQGMVRLAQLVDRTMRQKRGGSFIDGGTDVRPGSALEPLDPLWCVAFDMSGSIQGRWRGRAALCVTL